MWVGKIQSSGMIKAANKNHFSTFLAKEDRKKIKIDLSLLRVRLKNSYRRFHLLREENYY